MKIDSQKVETLARAIYEEEGRSKDWEEITFQDRCKYRDEALLVLKIRNGLELLQS